MYDSAEKRVFNTTEVNWCGKLCSASGMRHDPAKMCGLTLSAVPKPAANGSVLLAAVYWMNVHLPEVAERACILCDVLTPQIMQDKLPIILRFCGQHIVSQFFIFAGWSLPLQWGYGGGWREG